MASFHGREEVSGGSFAQVWKNGVKLRNSPRKMTLCVPKIPTTKKVAKCVLK